MMKNEFLQRHNGPSAEQAEQMCKTIGVKNVEDLIDKTIPAKIRLPKPLNIAKGMTEFEFLNHIKILAMKNKTLRSYIGAGYYGTILPSVILRNIFENPGWYTSYTPYQAEISQGRLEALLNYQTMICELTAMPLANASLLDEATAAGEAMLMFFHARSREQEKNGVCKFFVAEDLFPQTIGVIKTNARAQGIELVIGKADKIQLDQTFFGAIVQYPNQYGAIYDYKPFVEQAHALNISVAVAADLMSLILLTPPGEW